MDDLPLATFHTMTDSTQQDWDAIMQHVHGQPGATQGLGHAFSQGQMVLDQKDTHGNGTPRTCCYAPSVTGQRPLRTPRQLSFKLKAW